MKSPKSRHIPEKRPWGPKRKRYNKKFYNSKEWKDTRNAYLSRYRQKLYREIPDGYWTLPGTRQTLTGAQVSYILSLDFLPCEICLKLFIAEAYSEVEKGHALDHIERVNPENAKDSKGWGDPFSPDNLQYLCKRHHDRKSSRERMGI